MSQGQKWEGWSGAFTKLAAFAGLGKGESHSTTEQYNVLTQAIVPLVQLIEGAALSSVWLGALWFCRQPFIELFMAASRLDMFFVVGIFMVLGLIGKFVIASVLDGLDDEPVYHAISFTASFAFQLSFAWTVLNIIYALVAELEGIELLKLAICIPIMLLTPLFVARMAVEVFNPRHPLDPRIKRMDRIIDLMDGDEAEVQQSQSAMLRVIPSISANGVTATSKTEGYINLHPETIDLINFIKTAKKLGERNHSSGLAKAEWLPTRKRPLVGKPIRQEWDNPHREYGVTRVGRETYEELIELCIKWKFVEPGGGGYAASWKMPPDKALDILKAEIDRQIKMDNGE